MLLLAIFLRNGTDMETIIQNNHAYDSVTVFKKNPFDGYLERLRIEAKEKKVDISYVHEVVNTYFKLIGKDKMPKSFYKGRYGYPKLASEAKRLLEQCGSNLDDALWCLDKMKYIAGRKGFDWSIGTCIKYNLKSWGI